MKLHNRRLDRPGSGGPAWPASAWPRAAATTTAATTAAAAAVAATSRSPSCPRTSATPTSTPARRRQEGGRRVRRHVRGGRPATTRAPDAQVPYINTAAQQGVSAIVVSANDPKALCDALNEARDAGVKVVTFDSDTDPECRDLFINQATAEGIAKVQVDLIAEQIGDAGEIAILSATANATNQNAWIEMMKTELASQPPEHQAGRHGLRRRRRPEVVRQDRRRCCSPTRTSRASSRRPRSASRLRPATCPTRTYKGKVALTGLGTPNQMREFVKDGTVTAFALWNPADLGYLAAYAANALVSGEITGERGRQVQGRQARRVHRRRRRRRAPRRPVRVQRRQHRPLQLLSRVDQLPAGPAPASGRPAPAPAAHRRKARSMQRVCFQLQVRPDRLDEYRERHAAVWPDMLAALPTTGWHNYSLFLRDDGLLIGYFETDDLAGRAGRRWPATEVNARWQAEMAEFFVDLDGRAPDQGFLVARRGLPPGGPARDERTDTNDEIDMTTFSEIAPLLEGQAIEVPSWAFGNSGTRFKVFGQPGHPAHRRGEDRRRRAGAPVHRARADASRCTSRGTRSTTTPRSRAYAEDHGVALGTINSNTFQDDDYKLGSADPPRPGGPRSKAIDHHLECIDIMDATGSRDLKIWLADGTNYPGQDDMRGRQDRLAEALADDLRPARRRPAAGAGVQVLRAGVLPHRRPGLGHVVRPRAPRSATGRWSASTPATTRPAPTSSSSSRSCCGSGSSARSTSTPASTPTTT